MTGTFLRSRAAHRSRLPWWLGAVAVLGLASTAALLAATRRAEGVRDEAEAALRRTVRALAQAQPVGLRQEDALRAELDATPLAPQRGPYIVISLADHRLWYRHGDTVLFSAPVGTGTGKTLVRDGGLHWRFDTPRGRLTVVSKELDPLWIAPEWHYVEESRKRGLGLLHMTRSTTIPLPDGSQIAVLGNDVVRRLPEGRVEPYSVSEGHEIVVGGRMVVPPDGTNQRVYAGILGTRRLNIGDGYGIHGTNHPETVGRSVSHGCVRLRNEDVERLYDLVDVGTRVFIY
jgi:hypothetical protein